MRDEPPQYVSEALTAGWQYLAVRCGYCQRRARIQLSTLKPQDRLVSVISRIRCSKCDGRRPMIGVMIGREHISTHEKPILVEGNRVWKIGMT